VAERTYEQRVDDTILVGSMRLSRFRKHPLRSMIEGHREQCGLNLGESLDTDMEPYWKHRITRCNTLLQHDDLWLRREAFAALDREEKRS